MLQENEKWIEGFEDRYAVNTKGEIISYVRKPRLIMAGAVIYNTKRGSSSYRIVSLMKDGVQTCLYNHRCVAQAFLPNPENKPFVNHIDGDKTNNTLENLEWVTAKENTDHARDVGLFDEFTEKVVQRGIDNVKSFVLTGEYDYASVKSVFPRLTKEILVENHIPAEMKGVSLILGYPLKTWNHYIDLFRLLDSDRSSTEISKIVKLDISMISLLRNGKRGKKARKIYDKYKADPHYFVNYQKVYNYI